MIDRLNRVISKYLGRLYLPACAIKSIKPIALIQMSGIKMSQSKASSQLVKLNQKHESWKEIANSDFATNF